MAGMVLTFSAAPEQLDLSAKRRVVFRDLEGSTPSLGAKVCMREREEGGEEVRVRKKQNKTLYVYTCKREYMCVYYVYVRGERGERERERGIY